MMEHLLKLLDGGTSPIKMNCSDLKEEAYKKAFSDYRMRSTKPASGKVS